MFPVKGAFCSDYRGKSVVQQARAYRIKHRRAEGGRSREWYADCLLHKFVRHHTRSYGTPQEYIEMLPEQTRILGKLELYSLPM